MTEKEKKICTTSQTVSYTHLKIVIDQNYVKEKFAEKIHPDDIDRYIL